MLATRSCFILAIYFVITGIWGLFSPVVLGIFTTDTLHAVIELALAAAAMACAHNARKYPYLVFVGVLLIVVGVLRFIPPTANIVISLLNVNPALAIANIIIGVASLGVALQGRSPEI